MRLEFSKATKREALDLSKGNCAKCGLPISGRPEYDHIIPAALGGEASLDNCAVLCSKCHREKTSKSDVPTIAKVNRIAMKAKGIWPKSRRPLRSRGFDKSRPMMDPDS